MSSTSHALEIKNLYYSKGYFSIKDLNLYVDSNEVLGVYASPGMGKTTLAMLIGNALEPEYGEILYFGQSMRDDEILIKEKISIIYDTPNFNLNLKIETLAKAIKKLDKNFDFENFLLDAKREKLDFKTRLKNYSKSDLKVLSLLIALNRNTQILVLDDLKIGIEKDKINQINNLIKEAILKKKLAILFLTSDKDAIKQLADRIFELNSKMS
ncbi:ATP-binding cassette domain-containing protein [Lachnobacterium bovis]|uniref:ABC transporter n=1 Tax=Lachnobacterium bovis TaxID=140626 RepID=A0A1H9S2G7_9FIRM|nr:ATP-binding cassette domain-containing protein [Lachnobacterium bovis]SER79222.1 ABC transporter [Lachnobacterium bovis]